MSSKRHRFRNMTIKKRDRKRVRHCMDVEGGDLGENARIIRYPCHNGTNQKFHYNKKTKQLIAKHSRKCVENIDGRLYQRKCSSKKYTQKWKKSKRKNSWVSLADHKCVDSDIVTDQYGSKHLITKDC